MIQRRTSTGIRVGDVIVGGGAPITVQSMTKTDTRDVARTVRQILELEECGCEIIRVAVPDSEAAAVLPAIKRAIHIPLIADVHFDYRLALAALDAGVDGLRLNPGNISREEHITAIVGVARSRQIPIRIGVNAGSLPGSSDTGLSIAERMVDAAAAQIRLLECLDFDLIKLSLKAFDVSTTIKAYQLAAEQIPYPLHLGITEAGLPRTGSIRSAVGLGILLYQGIGDTIRVSLTGDPREEVLAGYEILKSLALREKGPILISCPTCGRCEVDIVSLANAVERRLSGLSRPIKVAVMGCVVNGPGEAKAADVGIACGRGKGAIFRNGQVVRTVAEEDFLEALMQEVVAL